MEVIVPVTPDPIPVVELLPRTIPTSPFFYHINLPLRIRRNAFFIPIE